MKTALLLTLLLTLTGCAPAQPPPAVEVMAPAEAPAVLSLGLAATAHLGRSMHATEAFPGRVQLEVAVAAVLVDVVWKLGRNAVKNGPSSIAVMVIAFVLTFFLKVNVIFIILGAIALGAVRALLERRRSA